MIATEIEARCKYDGRPIVRVPGRRPREFCNDVCRQRYHRQHQQGKHEQPTLEQQNLQAALEKLSSAGDRIQKLERQVQVQRSRIGELTEENRTLRTQVDQARDIEEAFSTDTDVHSFKKFLASHRYHADRPGCKKFLALVAQSSGSRGTYTNEMRRAGFTLDEESDVWAAWKDMLRDELFKSYSANRDKS